MGLCNFALAGTPVPKEVQVDQASNGKAFRLFVGQILSLRLLENPSTGFQWIVEENESSPLEQKESMFRPTPGGPGAGGTRVFRFLAKGIGLVRLKLMCQRPWFAPSKPSETFSINLRIRAPERGLEQPVSTLESWKLEGAFSDEEGAAQISFNTEEEALPGEGIDWKTLKLSDDEMKTNIQLSLECFKYLNMPTREQLPSMTAEAWAIFSYTSRGYMLSNRFLRTGNASFVSAESILALCRLIGSAINQLPDFCGKVYRVLWTESEWLIARYKPGCIVTEHAFTSCASSKKGIEEYIRKTPAEVNKGAKVFFVIESQTGKEIKKFSQFKQEGEVIFRPETSFKVIKNEKSMENGKETFKIRLKEI